MSTLEQEIENLNIKTEHASQKFNELRELLIEINRDLEIVKEYQKHYRAHCGSRENLEKNSTKQ